MARYAAGEGKWEFAARLLLSCGRSRPKQHRTLGPIWAPPRSTAKLEVTEGGSRLAMEYGDWIADTDPRTCGSVIC
jgi:hypothetical protein